MSREPFSDIFRRAPDDALAGFVRRWYGVTLDDAPVPTDVPPALRRLHQVHAVAPAFYADNHLLSAAQRTREGDKEVFYAENQWVAVWGINADELGA